MGEELSPGQAYIEKRTRELSVAQDANEAKLAELRRANVNIDANLFGALRLEVMAEAVFGDMADPRRLSYEIAVQHRIRKALDDITSQVNRARLTQPLNGRILPKLN